MLLLKRIASVVFLLGCLPPPANDGTQPREWPLGAPPSELKTSGIPTIHWQSDWAIFQYPPVPYWCWCLPTASSSRISLCEGGAKSGVEVVQSTLASLGLLLLTPLVINVNIVIYLNLPAYHHGRALHIIQGLSEDTDSDSQLKAWEQLIRPLMGEWKTVCVLATLISGAALAMFQISSFSNNPITPALAYLTLLCTMTSILLSSIIIIHLGGETTDPEFIRTWLENFRGTDHRPLWSAWVIVSLPSVWTVCGAFVFISSMAFLFWSKPGVTATANTASSSSSATSNAAATPEPSSAIPAFLAVILLLGISNILGVVFSFWKQGRRRSTPLEGA